MTVSEFQTQSDLINVLSLVSKFSEHIFFVLVQMTVMILFYKQGHEEEIIYLVTHADTI